MPIPEPAKKRRIYRIMGELLNVGLVFPAAIAVGYAVGFLLDRWWDSAPWMTTILSVLGALAAFLNLFRMAARIEKR